MDAYRRYIKFFGLLLAALAAATAALNLTADPFNAFPLSPDGLLPHRDHGSRTSKAERLAAERWQTVVIGSSRAETSLDPEEEAWGSAPNYNAGLSGAGQLECNFVAEYALECGPPRAIVLCVNLLGLARARGTQADFETSRFNPRLDRFAYVLGLTLGGGSLEYSSRTLRIAAGLREAEEHRPNGFRPVFDDDPPEPRALFESTLRAFLTDPTNYVDFQYDAGRVEHLERVAAACRDAGVELALVIPPVHALQLEVIRALGHWDQLEQFKRDLAALAESVGPPVVLWDFTGYSGRVAEPVPASGDPELMQWFYESSHATPALGREVILRIRGHPDADPDFGVRLTADSLEGHLQQLRRERDTYAEREPDAGWVRELHRATAANREALRGS